MLFRLILKINPSLESQNLCLRHFTDELLKQFILCIFFENRYIKFLRLEMCFLKGVQRSGWSNFKDTNPRKRIYCTVTNLKIRSYYFKLL